MVGWRDRLFGCVRSENLLLEGCRIRLDMGS